MASIYASLLLNAGILSVAFFWWDVFLKRPRENSIAPRLTGFGGCMGLGGIVDTC
jgi:hypothetical protein